MDLGNGQSGDFFKCKTHFLQPVVQDVLVKSLCRDSIRGPFDSVQFYYPSGVLPAEPDSFNQESNHMWAWGYGDPAKDRIRGLEATIDYIFRFIDTHGPFIGIMGFSTGATIAAIVASLLEKRNSVGSLRFDVSASSLGLSRAPE